MPIVISGTNGISGVDGTASNPSYEGTDANTGVFFPAADTVAIGTNGTEALRVNSSQNVGVGTTSPQKKFVVSNAGAAGLELDPFTRSATTGASLLAYNRSGAAFVRMDYDASQHLFFLSGTQAMTLDASGNLGVGYSSPSQFTGSNKYVFGTAATTTTSAGITVYTGNATYGGIYFADGITGTEPYRGAVEYNHSVDQLLFYSGGDLRARFDSSGNFGLGTTPAYKLDVNGVAFLQPSTVISSPANGTWYKVLNNIPGNSIWQVVVKSIKSANEQSTTYHVYFVVGALSSAVQVSNYTVGAGCGNAVRVLDTPTNDIEVRITVASVSSISVTVTRLS